MSQKKVEASSYLVKNVEHAKEIAKAYLQNIEFGEAIEFGLPEIDDRYHIWRVPLKNKGYSIGEIVIDSITSSVNEKKSTNKQILEARMLEKKKDKTKKNSRQKIPKTSTLSNTIGFGDSEQLLQEIPAESIDLIFTSPPYYNARPEYADYTTYPEYLEKIRKIIKYCHRVLNEGRFFVINISPVIIRRPSRSEASKRIAVPFDFHQLFKEEGYEFIDDIIWVKPEGAGWATGRGRRFAADRNPLQYKPVPVTEYILVYRKQTDKLIDWHIRKHPNKQDILESKIEDGYEITNIWKIHPTYSKIHPAIFPVQLAEKVILYYSFKNDVVLDPFAGIGTVGEAASKRNRRFVLFEKNLDYMNELKKKLSKWQCKIDSINWINTNPP